MIINSLKKLAMPTANTIKENLPRLPGAIQNHWSSHQRISLKPPTISWDYLEMDEILQVSIIHD